MCSAQLTDDGNRVVSITLHTFNIHCDGKTETTKVHSTLTPNNLPTIQEFRESLDNTLVSMYDVSPRPCSGLVKDRVSDGRLALITSVELAIGGPVNFTKTVEFDAPKLPRYVLGGLEAAIKTALG